MNNTEQKNKYKEIIELALDEDLKPLGDLSSSLFAKSNKVAKAIILAKEDGIMAAGFLIEELCTSYSQRLGIKETCEITLNFKDGERFSSGKVIAEINGPAIVLLGIERSILNFLQRLCGVATYTKKLTSMVENYSCKLLDTRKTMPGMRALEKQAFRIGGGINHRFNLGDMVILKENHLAIIGLDLIEAITSIRLQLDAKPETKDVKIEVEINQDNLNKLEKILALPVDRVMLDNFSPAAVRDIIKEIRMKSKIEIELSGGINETNLVSYAKVDPDFISIGSVFTKAHNIDLSMMIS